MSSSMSYASRRRNAFTLIELLLVLVILAILAAVVVPKFTGRQQQAKESKAKADIATLSTQLRLYETDNGKFPTQEEGLNALIPKYIDKAQKDPWGNDYVYRIPGQNGRDFDLFSMGADGAEGGNDDIEP